MSGSPQITQVLPASAALSRTHAPGDNEGTSPTVAWGHGLMRNPGAAPSGATLAERQAVNNGVEANPEQGWDELRVATYTTPYDASKNIASGRTGQPVTATPGVYVKGISRTGATIESAGHGTIGALGILTVLASAPPQTRFVLPPHWVPTARS